MKLHYKTELLEEFCKRNHILYRRLDHYTLLLKINKRWIPFFNLSGPTVNLAVRRILQYKHLTLRLLRENGIKVPPFILFDKNNIGPLLEFAKQKHPIVIKPINGNRGRGVVTGIKNEESLIQAVENFSEPSGWGLAQQQFEGEDYRAFVVNGKLISFTKREPANVVGDGRLNIIQLIHKKNKKKLHINNRYYKNKLIPADINSLEAIKDSNMSLDSVPKDGQKVRLKYAANISLGGDSINHTHLVDEEMARIIVSAVNSVPGLVYAGVDILIKNLEAPNKEYVIIEMESSPDPTGMFHLFGDQADWVSPVVEFYHQVYR